MKESDLISATADTKEQSISAAVDLLMQRLDEKKLKEKPDIPVFKMLVAFFIWLFIIVALCFLPLFAMLIDLPFYFGGVGIFLAALTIFLKFKAFIRGAVLFYQRFAPIKLRRACLFEPSCSEYMLLSLEKYGGFRGFFKGVGRLLRCHSPNGGIDYP